MPSSRLQLSLVSLAPALAALACAALLLWVLLPGVLEEATADHLSEEARLLARQVEAIPASALADWVRGLPEPGRLRITLVGADGRVLADSARAREQVSAMDNHGDRPEVRQALARGEGRATRNSETTGDSYVYVAHVLRDREGRRLVLRLARPLASVAQLRGHVALALVPAAAAALLAAAAASLWFDRRLFRPLLRLLGDAGQLAAGRYEHRAEPSENELLHGLGQALNRLAARIGEEIRAAEAERDQLRTILTRMSEGVLVVGADGRALLANPAFRGLFGLSGEVAGLGPLEISRQASLARIVEDTLRSGGSESAEVDLELPVRRNLSLASASLGIGAGAVVVARDTTAFAQLAKVRRDFVANVSHELKTPLAAIRGYAETLSDGALDDRPAAQRFTGRILVQCRRLQALLDDLLTLSRLESVEAAAVPQERVDLAAVAQRAVELMAEPAREKGVEVTVARRELPPVLGHAASLERLAVNLVENAVKYNRPGGQVRVRLGREGDQILLEVADTGLGIPAEALPRIFERFYRVDKGRAREEGGTGLGLAIVKHIAQLHGGRVEVESEERKGSTFRVYLPAA